MASDRTDQDINKLLEVFSNRVFETIWKRVFLEWVRSGAGLKKREQERSEAASDHRGTETTTTGLQRRGADHLHAPNLPTGAARWVTNATLDIEHEAGRLVLDVLTTYRPVVQLLELSKHARKAREKKVMQLADARQTSARTRTKDSQGRAALWLEKFEAAQKERPGRSDDQILRDISKHPPFKSTGEPYSHRQIGKVVYKARREREKHASQS